MLNSSISKNSFLEFFFISILIIFPKINLITFRGFYQGIRLEEIVIIFFLFYLLITRNVMLKERDTGSVFIYYFFIFLAASFLGAINFNQDWIVLIRYLEYIIIILFFNRYKPNVSILFKILKFFLILNLIFVILQMYDIIGEFSSIGYEPVDAEIRDDRHTGLTGGPWELSNISAIIFFILFLQPDQSKISRIFFSVICIFLISVTASRTVFVAFFIAAFIHLLTLSFKNNKFLSLILVMIFGILSYKILDFIVTETPYLNVFNMYLNFFLNYEIPDKDILDGKLWSIALRIEHWAPLYEQFLSNELTIFFGAGGTSRYYESTILRIIFSTGLIGLLYTLFNIKKMPLFILVFFLLSGLTLDMFLSLKIFMVSFLFFYIKDFEKNK